MPALADELLIRPVEATSPTLPVRVIAPVTEAAPPMDTAPAACRVDERVARPATVTALLNSVALETSIDDDAVTLPDAVRAATCVAPDTLSDDESVAEVPVSAASSVGPVTASDD